MANQRYQLTLEVPRGTDDAEAVRLLRAALKRLWRGYGLRCVRAERADDRTPNVDGEFSYPVRPAEGIDSQLLELQNSNPN